MVIVVQIGMISPPVGMNIFVVKNLLPACLDRRRVPRRHAVHLRSRRAAGGDRRGSRARDLAAELHAVIGSTMGRHVSWQCQHALRQVALDFDLKRLDVAFLADPFPVYRALREHDPVHRMPDGSFFLSRYDDCAAVYRNPATWSSDKKVDFRPNFGTSSLYEHHTTSLVFNDPPYHSRVPNCWRRPSRPARSGHCSRASKRWSLSCSTAPPCAAAWT